MISMPDANGRFGFNAIAPGKYRVYAWPDLTAIRYRDPLFFSTINNKSLELSTDNETQLNNVEPALIKTQ